MPVIDNKQRGDSSSVEEASAAAAAIADALDEPRRVRGFRRRRQPYDPSRSVTVCTQLSVERLSRLAALAENYAGPVSAVVYVGYRLGGDDDAEAIARFWENNPAMTRYVDLHLVIRPAQPWFVSGDDIPNPYPINLLRQLSVEYATTDWVLVLEADMLTPVNGHERLLATWDELLRQESTTAGDKVVFVVPLYHFVLTHKEQENDLKALVPNTKSKLAKAVADKTTNIMRMGDLYISHRGLNYNSGESSSSSSSDQFIAYNTNEKQQYEPYFLIRKDCMPPYDILFWSMPMDKVTQFKDVIAAGFTFLVQPSLYAVHFSTDGILGEPWLPAKLNSRFYFTKRMHNFRVQEQEAAKW